MSKDKRKYKGVTFFVYVHEDTYQRYIENEKYTNEEREKQLAGLLANTPSYKICKNNYCGKNEYVLHKCKELIGGGDCNLRITKAVFRDIQKELEPILFKMFDKSLKGRWLWD